MTKREKLWGGLVIIIILLGYFLPFTVLKNVTVWNGSFLLWTVLALLIILINYLLTRNWGE